MRQAIFFITVFFTNLVLFQSLAIASEWVVTSVRQPARFTTDSKNWVMIKRGMVIPNASWINTGTKGRLLLNRNAETIQFKPNTLAAIVKRNKSGTKTLVRQQFGSLLLDVETRKQKHFKVETPFLAAVVKGTRFIVDVGSRSAKLAVERGAVEVTDERRGERSVVHTNQSVNINNDANSVMTVVGTGRKEKITRVKVSAPKIKPNLSATKIRKNLVINKNKTPSKSLFSKMANSIKKAQKSKKASKVAKNTKAATITKAKIKQASKLGKTPQKSLIQQAVNSIKEAGRSKKEKDSSVVKSRSGRKSKTDGKNKSVSRDKSSGKSKSVSKSKSDGKSKSSSRSKSDGKSKSASRSKSGGKSKSTSRSKSDGKSKSASRSKSGGKSKSTSRSKSGGKSKSSSRSKSGGKSKSESRSKSGGKSKSESRSKSSGKSKSESRSKSGGKSKSESKSKSGGKK